MNGVYIRGQGRVESTLRGNQRAVGDDVLVEGDIRIEDEEST